MYIYYFFEKVPKNTLWHFWHYWHFHFVDKLILIICSFVVDLAVWVTLLGGVPTFCGLVISFGVNS